MTAPSRSPRSFSIAIGARFAAVVGLACLMLVVVVGRAVQEADFLAEARQEGVVRQALLAQIAQVPNDQESVAIWDDAVERIAEGDLVWINENLGEWVFEYFGHDRVVVFNSELRPVYAMEGGQPAPAGDVAAKIDGLDAYLAELRRPDAVERHERLHEEALATVAAREARMHGNAPHITEIAIVEDRPAVVSAMVVIPHTDRLVVLPGDEPIHVSVQFLDGAFLAEIAGRFQLDEARIVPAQEAAEEVGNAAIRNRAGDVVATLAWTPPRPGSEIVRSILPVGLVALMLILATTVILLRRLGSTSAAVEAGRAYAEYLAFTDQLTGLPNRHRLSQWLEQAVSEPQRHDAATALVIFDVNRIQAINEAHGHLVGDELIRAFGKRLEDLVGQDGKLARLGGDKFAAVVSGQAAGDVAAFCERALQSVSQPFVLAGSTAHVSASIGAVAVCPPIDRHELLRRADVALNDARTAGANHYRIFEEGIDRHVRRRHSIEHALREALATGDGLDVHYQPKVSTASGRLAGVEALARWRHGEFGTIAPETFVAIAEECGLVVELDEWVLRRATTEARYWPDVSLAVNTSPHAFRRTGAAERILAILAETGYPPHRLEIEITETVIVDLTEATKREIESLRSKDVRIALDDFGTGYASLNHLSSLRVDRIKIDRSFVRGLGATADSTTIVSAVVRLGHAMGIAVTAEGVETEAQREFLEAVGCDEMQGFLFGEPMPGEEMAALIRNRPAAAIVRSGGRRATR